MQYIAQSDIWRLDNSISKARIQVKNQSKVLGRFRQVFPLKLFPDELIIEELRIVHIQNNGPWSKQVISIMATDIACVYSSSGPFFGRIHIQSLTGGPEIMIDNLHKSDAIKSRSLIEGIAMSSREGLKIADENLAAERQNLLQAGAVMT